MKKLVAFITVLCLIVSACLVAFAYGQAPSTVDWVSNISCDAEGNIIVTTTAEMKAAAAYTWQVAIFTEAPTFPDGDDGFSQVYRRSDTGSFEKDAEFANDATYVGGKNGCGAAGDTLSIAATGLVSGQTYYAMFAANSDGGNGWSWLNKAYQFTCGTAQATVHTEPENISTLAVNGGTLNVNLLDTFTNARPSFISVWENNGSIEVIDTSSDKGIKVTTANGWMSGSLSAWDGANAAMDFVHKTSADTKYLVLSMTVDGKLDSIGIEPQFTGTPGGLRQAYLNDGTDPIYLVDVNGTTAATVEYSSYRYQITNIPEDFSGYIVVPTSRFRLTQDGSEYSNFGEGTYADFVNMYVFGLYAMSSNNDSFVIDKIYHTTADIVIPELESWITDATVVDEGLVNLTFGNLGDDTSWSEIAIFTEDRGALDFATIYASALSRPGNHSVWGGHKEGTVGTNGQFAFDLVDGTTYYVYVVRNAGGVWDDDHLIKPFSFTYNAPQETPDPTPTPTVVPDDDENETADISVALYAITALAGAGAVVAIKRKKA